MAQTTRLASFGPVLIVAAFFLSPHRKFVVYNTFIYLVSKNTRE